MDESAKASSYLFEAISVQVTSPEAPNAISRAFNINTSFWEFFELPGQEDRLRRFGLAMEGVVGTEPRDVILKGGFHFFYMTYRCLGLILDFVSNRIRLGKCRKRRSNRRRGRWCRHGVYAACERLSRNEYRGPRSPISRRGRFKGIRFRLCFFGEIS